MPTFHPSLCLFIILVREKLNSMNLLLYMAPIAVVLLLPATLVMEENVVGITMALAREDFKLIWYLLFNSTLAYFVNLTNFLVTKHTSALTLQVCSTLNDISFFLFVVYTREDITSYSFCINLVGSKKVNLLQVLCFIVYS